MIFEINDPRDFWKLWNCVRFTGKILKFQKRTRVIYPKSPSWTCDSSTCCWSYSCKYNFWLSIALLTKLSTEIAFNFHLIPKFHESSVTRQNGASQNGCFKKTNHVKFSKKRTLLIPWYAHIRTYVSLSGGKKCSFFVKFAVLCFLETPVLRCPILPY